MRKKFTILKNRLNIEIRITRDSVCMADDCDAPHEKIITQPSFTEPIIFINNLKSGYLTFVSGVGHEWDCFLNDVLIGNISISGNTSKINEIEYLDVNNVHFKYHSSAY